MKWEIDPADPAPLHTQIAGCVVHALDDGDLAVGERLPPAAELAGVLGVNPNTVLHAYRRLRDQGVLEFRRGRGVRVSAEAVGRGRVLDAATHLLALGRSYGYSAAALAELVEELA